MHRFSFRVASSALVAALLVLAGSSSATGAGRNSHLPEGFQAQSISWANAQRGWLMGAQDCGQSSCATILRTTDGGTTWNSVGSMSAPVTNELATGVTEVRFA